MLGTIAEDISLYILAVLERFKMIRRHRCRNLSRSPSLSPIPLRKSNLNKSGDSEYLKIIKSGQRTLLHYYGIRRSSRVVEKIEKVQIFLNRNKQITIYILESLMESRRVLR